MRRRRRESERKRERERERESAIALRERASLIITGRARGCSLQQERGVDHGRIRIMDEGWGEIAVTVTLFAVRCKVEGSDEIFVLKLPAAGKTRRIGQTGYRPCLKLGTQTKSPNPCIPKSSNASTSPEPSRTLRQKKQKIGSEPSGLASQVFEEG